MGVNIISGLTFLELDLREEDSLGEISMICVFDGGRVRSWTYSESLDWKLRNVGDSELSDLLNGKVVEVMRWFGERVREPRYLRIKRHDEYFDWKRCKKYTAISAVVTTATCLIMILYVTLVAVK